MDPFPLKYIIYWMSKIKLILIFLGLAGLFFLSDVIYLYNHPNELSVYSIAVAKTLNSKGDLDGAFYILTRTAGIISIKNYYDNPEIVQKDAYRLKLPDNKQFKIDVTNYMNSLPGNISDIRGKYDLARVFYDFAIFAFKDGLKDQTPKFLRLSIDLNPSLSYWSVELANNYLYNGDRDAAKKILDSCMTINASRQHCQDYFNDNFVNNHPNEVGFLGKIVSNYYNPGMP